MLSKNLLPNFSHIYIEKAAIDYHITNSIRLKYPKSKIIEVDHYKDIFNRKGQDFQLQKSSMNLIMAKKTSPLLYAQTEMIQEYDTPNTYYITPVLNCLYNCDYCFLQGMYDSANIVIFVNIEDFQTAILKKITQLEDSKKPMVVAISYSTDLMAMENIFPMASKWIEFASDIKNLIIEIRTKSGLFSLIKDIKSSKNIILSWTISPRSVAKKYEKNAPPLETRLKSIAYAVERGWRVRLCFDPVMILDNWSASYKNLFREVFSKIDPLKINDVTLGTFRMNRDYYKKIRKSRPKSDIYYDDFTISKNIVAVDIKLREIIMQKLETELQNFISKRKILVWR